MTRARLAILVALATLGIVVPAGPASSEPPSNDTFGGAVEIDPESLPYSESRDTSEATTDADDVAANADCGAPATDASVWYSFTSDEDSNLLVSTAESDYSAGVIAVLTGEPGSFDLVTCGPSGVAFPVEGGVTYYFLVFDDQGDGGGNGGQLELMVDAALHLCGPPGAEVPATIVSSGVITGTARADVIVGSAGRDQIFALGGDDIVCGEGGNDLISGGAGDDLLIGDGDDLPPFVPSNGDNDDSLNGGPGDDTLVGLGGDDNLRGGRGNDTLIGMGGEDSLRGDLGDDLMFGGPGDDHLRGDGGTDVMFGNYGSDVLRGGSGDDFLDGDNPFEPPAELPFPPGGNEDRCNGGTGVDEVVNCELGNLNP